MYGVPGVKYKIVENQISNTNFWVGWFFSSSSWNTIHVLYFRKALGTRTSTMIIPVSRESKVGARTTSLNPYLSLFDHICPYLSIFVTWQDWLQCLHICPCHQPILPQLPVLLSPWFFGDMVMMIIIIIMMTTMMRAPQGCQTVPHCGGESGCCSPQCLGFHLQRSSMFINVLTIYWIIYWII